MPALGADMEAGMLVTWRRKPGETLRRGDVIAEVETDKGLIEVEVFADGVLERYLVEAGQKVPVGTPLAILSEVRAEPHLAPPDPTGAQIPQPAPQPEQPVAPSLQPMAAGVIAAPPSIRRRARELGLDVREVLSRAQRVTRADLESARPLAAAPAALPRLRSSPAARRRASELGVALEQVRGTGPEGAIVVADVERAAAATPARTAGEREPAPAPQPAAAKAAAPAQPEDARQALRRAIGAAMSRAKREIPHYYLTTTIDLGAMTAWLARYNLERSVGDRVLPAALLLKAVARAAKQLPDFNSLWRGDAAERQPEVHLGVAVALRGGGLVAPAIHRADSLELPALMQKLSDLVARARSGSLRSSELSAGTLTVTSLGERGVDGVLPIIYAPQTAIVGFGRIAERPWVIDSKLVVRPLVTASLAADHRVTDGHLGARFLNLIDQLLQTPETL